MARLVVDMAEVLTPQEAANMLGVGIATFWRRLRAGRLHPIRVSGRTFVLRAEVLLAVARERNAQLRPTGG